MDVACSCKLLIRKRAQPIPANLLQPKNVMLHHRVRNSLKGRLQRLTTSLNVGATAPPQTFFIESHAAQLRVVKEKRLSYGDESL